MVTPTRNVRSFVRVSVRLFVRRAIYTKQNKNPKWESTVAVAEAVSCERDHDRKTSGVPLVIVSANDTCSNCIYLKKSQSNQRSFSLPFLFQNINQAQAVARSSSLERGDDQEHQVPSKLPLRKEWAKNNKVEVRLFATSERVVACRCAPAESLAIEQLKMRHGISVIHKNKNKRGLSACSDSWVVRNNTKQNKYSPGNLEPVTTRGWPQKNQQHLSPVVWLTTNVRPQACACVSVSDETK